MRHLAVLLPLAFVATAPLAAAEPVAVSAFRSVELRGGGNVVIHRGPSQQVTITAGSSRFTHIRIENGSKLVIDACNERCPRNYDLRIDITSPTVPDSAIAGGGNIDIDRGFAGQADLALAIRGGGTIDARSVAAADISAAVSGGGTILAGPSQTLLAAVRGGGEVRYAGNPQVNTAIAGGGTVERSE